MEPATGKKLTGEEAPLMSQVQDWLAQHPGWEIDSETDEDSDSDDDDDRKMKSESTGCIIPVYFLLVRALVRGEND